MLRCGGDGHRKGRRVGALFVPKELRVLMLGLDGAGKTTILYRLKLGETVTTIPTIGFNVETISIGHKYEVTMWDVGGQPRIRALWRHYYENTDVVLFVVDLSAPERFDEARNELRTIMSEETLGDACLVLLFNKTDLVSAAGGSTDAAVAHALNALEWDTITAARGERHCTFAVRTNNADEETARAALLTVLTDRLGCGSGAAQAKRATQSEEVDPETALRMTLSRFRLQISTVSDAMLRELSLPVDIAGFDAPSLVDFPAAIVLQREAPTALPPEILTLVVEFLNITDLLPHEMFHVLAPRKLNAAAGPWLTCRTMMTLCFDEAMLRLAARKSPESDLQLSIERRARAVTFLSVPATMQRLHVTLVAALHGRLLVEKSRSYAAMHHHGFHLTTLQPCKAACAGGVAASPYAVVRPLMFLLANFLLGSVLPLATLSNELLEDSVRSLIDHDERAPSRNDLSLMRPLIAAIGEDMAIAALAVAQQPEVFLNDPVLQEQDANVPGDEYSMSDPHDATADADVAADDGGSSVAPATATAIRWVVVSSIFGSVPPSAAKLLNLQHFRVLVFDEQHETGVASAQTVYLLMDILSGAVAKPSGGEHNRMPLLRSMILIIRDGDGFFARAIAAVLPNAAPQFLHVAVHASASRLSSAFEAPEIAARFPAMKTARDGQHICFTTIAP